MRVGFDSGRIILGVFLVLIGILWLLDMLGFIRFNICIIGPLLLIAAGFALLIKRDEWW